MAGRITAIEAQKKNRNRVNVYIDGRFAFGLADMEAARLSVGQYLSDEDVHLLCAVDEQARAYETALDLLSFRPRSQAEVAERLQKKGFGDPAIQSVLQRLSQAGLVDDEAFARYWISNRDQFKPRSVRALRYELRQKGVPDSILEEAMQETDDVENAYRAALPKVAGWRHLDPAAFRRKLAGHLGRRGFSYEVIAEVWERIQAEGAADDEKERKGKETWD